MFYNHVFCSLYRFYLDILKEKQLPFLFSISFLTFLETANLMFLDTVTRKFLKFDLILTKYFAVYIALIFILNLIYFKYKRRYELSLERYSKLSKKEKRTKGIITTLYVFVSFVLIFLLD